MSGVSSDPVEVFVRAHLDGLELERQAEVDEAERLAKTKTPAELERLGVLLRRLEVRDTSYGFRGRVHWELGPTQGRGAEFPAHRMQPGDLVAIRQRPDETDPPQGVIARVRRDQIVVALDGDDHDPPRGPVQIDRLANDVTYRRLRDSLEDLRRLEKGRGRRLREIFFGLRPAEALGEDRRGGASGDTVADLNDSQRAAVALALQSTDIALIHGPPGTGKTTTVVAAIRAAVSRGERVLACAGSNVAVDNLTEKLVAAGIRVVRLGHPARLLPSVVDSSLDAQLDKSEAMHTVRELRRELDVSLKRLRRARDRDHRRDQREEVRILRQGIREMERRAAAEIVQNAAVVLTTNVGAADSRLAGHEFDVAVIDEAAQALEASCWIPILKASRVVLAGDHLQLPPTIRSDRAAKAGLAVTLFERLIELFPERASLLATQYRMNDTIMQWSSQAMYDGKLLAAPEVALRKLSELEGVTLDDHVAPPFLWVDTAGFDAPEEVDEEGVARWNNGEARLVARHVGDLIEGGVSPEQIAVITPYNAQVDLLRRRFADVDGLEVDTVDGFQGREKEAVVISMVRSNERGEVGFLADQRRMNVAVTRARRHVALFGDSATLSMNAFLGALVEYANGSGEYRSAYEYE